MRLTGATAPRSRALSFVLVALLLLAARSGDAATHRGLARRRGGTPSQKLHGQSHPVASVGRSYADSKFLRVGASLHKAAGQRGGGAAVINAAPASSLVATKADVTAAVKSAAAALRLASESPSRLDLDSGSVESQVTSEDAEKEAQLRADGASTALIPKGYEKFVAPKGRVDVKFRVLVQYFYSISMREELLDFGLKVFKMWRDPRLANQAAYEKRKEQDMKTGRVHHEGTEVDPALVWRPQSELRNAIERTVLSEEMLLFPDGHVLLTQRLRVKVTVDFDMLWFPFDQQALSFVFGTFGRATTDRVQLRTSFNMSWSPAFPQSDVRQNFLIEADLLERPQQSFRVLSFYGRDRTVMGEASRLKYSEVDCILRVQRGRWHYIIVFVVPMFLIVLVSAANYNFDMRDLEPRVTVSASLLLALVALQYSLEQQLPSVTYIMWMNWYLFICYVTISLQVLSFIVVVTVAGPQEDGTWTRKNHSDWRAAERGILEDSLVEVMGRTEVDPDTGHVMLMLNRKEDGKGGTGLDDGAGGDVAKSVGIVDEGDGADADGGGTGSGGGDVMRKNPVVAFSSTRQRISLMRVNKREARAKNLDWYFRWSYPLIFIFATFCMFMVVPSHLRLGKVDAGAYALGEQDAGSNALRNYEVTEEDGGEAGVGAPDLAVVEQPQEELAANAMESKDEKESKQDATKKQ